MIKKGLLDFGFLTERYLKASKKVGLDAKFFFLVNISDAKDLKQQLTKVESQLSETCTTVYRGEIKRVKSNKHAVKKGNPT